MASEQLRASVVFQTNPTVVDGHLAYDSSLSTFAEIYENAADAVAQATYYGFPVSTIDPFTRTVFELVARGESEGMLGDDFITFYISYDGGASWAKVWSNAGTDGWGITPTTRVASILAGGVGLQTSFVWIAVIVSNSPSGGEPPDLPES